MLKCWKVKRKFADVIDGVAEPEVKQRVLEHIRECSRCARLFEGLKKVEELARDVLQGTPYVDWADFEEKTIAKTMDKLARRGRLPERDKTG